MSYAKRTDGNQRAGNDYLRSIGWSVLDLSFVGGGVPDALVSRCGFTALVEWKNGEMPPSQRKLTEHQEKFHRDWKGVIVVATDPKDAAGQLLTAWRKAVHHA